MIGRKFKLCEKDREVDRILKQVGYWGCSI